MKMEKRVRIVLAAIVGLFMATSASATAIIGVAVDNFVDQNAVGSTEFRPLLGDDAIKYFIPLSGPDCTYGVGGCGTGSDTGNGGGTLSMNLMFNPVALLQSTLKVDFEDLDLIDANDPFGFFESVQVFDGSGAAITGLIDDISNSLVSGDADTQQLLSLDLGVLTDTTYFATLKFNASYYWTGTNTPEYLIASVHQTATVPEPATAALLALGLFGFAATRRRSRSTASIR